MRSLPKAANLRRVRCAEQWHIRDVEDLGTTSSALHLQRDSPQHSKIEIAIARPQTGLRELLPIVNSGTEANALELISAIASRTLSPQEASGSPIRSDAAFPNPARRCCPGGLRDRKRNA